MKALARRLKIDLPHAVGLMEMLWHYAGEFAPAGDLGKLPDEDIAEAVGWKKKPEALVAALLAERWLDPHPDHRFLVHDWLDHCDDTVHMKLARAGMRFACGTMPSMRRMSSAERERLEALFVRRESALPSQALALALPSQAKPSQAALGGGERRTSAHFSSRFREVVDAWKKPTAAGKVFACTQVDLAYQVWTHLVEMGTITDEFIDSTILPSIERHRASKQWRDGYVPSVATFFGWSKEGRPNAPRWNDQPDPAGTSEQDY